MSTDPKKKPETEPAGDPAQEPTNAAATAQEPVPDPQAAQEPAAAAEPAQEPAKEPEPAAEPAPDADGELTALREELQAANAKLAAYRAGVPAEAVDDAVVLALHDLQAAGKEATGDSVREAIDAVLNRHPGKRSSPRPDLAGAAAFTAYTCLRNRRSCHHRRFPIRSLLRGSLPGNRLGRRYGKNGWR